MNCLLTGIRTHAHNSKLAKAGRLWICRRTLTQTARHCTPELVEFANTHLAQTFPPKPTVQRLDPDREKQLHILSLGRVPITALPVDVARLLDAHEVKGYQTIRRDYLRFWPTDNMLVKFGSEGERDKAIQVLKLAKMMKINLKPKVYDPIQATPEAEGTEEKSVPSKRPRMRGKKGRDKLMAMGAISGDGPGASLPEHESGMNVVLSGLPGKLYSSSLQQELLKDFDLREDVTAVVKIHQ
ncbi:hypothetical protein FRB90_011993 [Tulasnella sp. 427]|nr:hypothetical protein FRB90_011993 [Tulasnella sp. 427]